MSRLVRQLSFQMTHVFIRMSQEYRTSVTDVINATDEASIFQTLFPNMQSRKEAFHPQTASHGPERSNLMQQERQAKTSCLLCQASVHYTRNQNFSSAILEEHSNYVVDCAMGRSIEHDNSNLINVH